MLARGSIRRCPLCGGKGAFFNGWWWWPIWPALAMVLILSSLALINMGMDELANPRIRKTE